MIITDCRFYPSESMREYTVAYANITIDGFIELSNVEIYTDRNPLSEKYEYVVEFPNDVHIFDFYIRKILKNEIIERYLLWKEDNEEATTEEE